MTEREKMEAIQKHASVGISSSAVSGSPRVQTTTYSSDIGSCHIKLRYPNPVGHAKEGLLEVVEEIVDTYTGPEA